MHMGALPPPPPPMGGPASTTRFRDAFAAAKKQYGPVPGGPGSPHQQRPFFRLAFALYLTKHPHTDMGICHMYTSSVTVVTSNF